MTIKKFTEKDRVEVENIFSKYWNDPIFLKELSDELDKNPDNFYVSKDNDEVVGVVGYRDIPDYLREFSRTENPIEFYVIASKYKRRGIGKKLKLKIIEVVKEKGFTEILLFSPGTHDESWKFHDTLDFYRMGEVVPPGDDEGYVWSRVL